MPVVLTDRHQVRIWPYGRVLKKSSKEQVIIYIIFFYISWQTETLVHVGFKPALLHEEAVQCLAFVAGGSVSVAKQ